MRRDGASPEVLAGHCRQQRGFREGFDRKRHQEKCRHGSEWSAGPEWREQSEEHFYLEVPCPSGAGILGVPSRSSSSAAARTREPGERQGPRSSPKSQQNPAKVPQRKVSERNSPPGLEHVPVLNMSLWSCADPLQLDLFPGSTRATIPVDHNANSPHPLLAGSLSLTGQEALELHPGELTVQEGNAATFQCSMRGGVMKDYIMYWYHQGLHGTLEWIYWADDSSGQGFQDHFKGSVESYKNRFTLQILAAKPGDTEMYYCGITLEQLCSRVEQKLSGGKTDLSAFLSGSCSPRAIVRKWQITEEVFGRNKDPFTSISNSGQKQMHEEQEQEARKGSSH
ncbi:hypothetical protein WISP_19689 [Willisornis vidua]|uniref:Ig-like domain-containing protein n=1 Tax=Willisornis vidua TaxID=1566151 RepID=A0ABQ9DNX5_9PASS|nr:hypothetical protein WISP_19689 [Willisornis vidua]